MDARIERALRFAGIFLRVVKDALVSVHSDDVTSIGEEEE